MKKPARGRKHKVYNLKKRGETTYIGETKRPPKQRAEEHRQDGREGKLEVVASFDSLRAARRSEASRLAHHRRTHDGKNPLYNKTASGGWKK